MPVLPVESEACRARSIEDVTGLARRFLLTALLALAGVPFAVRAAPSGSAVDEAALLRHVRALSVDVGVRPGGSAQERRAAAYIEAQLRAWGYATSRQPISLPGGRYTVNVIADLAGSTDRVWILGAHMDSKPPSPGANDNASGVAVVLECARLLAGTRPPRGIRFVLFGAEEVIDKKSDHHHFGSRGYVRGMPLRNVAGVIVVDSVAAGPHFVIGSMHRKSPLSFRLRAIAREAGHPAEAGVDPGWSDHEPFEKRGVPATYVRWRVDDALHTAHDDFVHVVPAKMRAAAEVVLTLLTD